MSYRDKWIFTMMCIYFQGFVWRFGERQSPKDLESPWSLLRSVPNSKARLSSDTEQHLWQSHKGRNVTTGHLPWNCSLYKTGHWKVFYLHYCRLFVQKVLVPHTMGSSATAQPSPSLASIQAHDIALLRLGDRPGTSAMMLILILWHYWHWGPDDSLL